MRTHYQINNYRINNYTERRGYMTFAVSVMLFVFGG